MKNTKTTKKITKKVNKSKAKKATTKKNTPKKSTTKAKKKVVKKSTTKKVTKTVKKPTKITKKTTVKKTNAKAKVSTKKTNKKPNWDNITITESGEIIDKNEQVNTNIEEDSNEGIYDKSGDWNGSTMADSDIEKIENPEEKRLCQEIDKLQEEIKRARDNGEDREYISNLVIEVSRLRMELNNLNTNYGDM